MDRSIFSKRLKTIREKNKLSQREFAEKVGISTATLSAYENNQKNPTTPILCAIADAFDLSTDWLLGIDNKSNTVKSVGDVLSLFNELFFALKPWDAGEKNDTNTYGDTYLFIHPSRSERENIFLGEKIRELFVLFDLQRKGTIELETYLIAAKEIIEKNKIYLFEPEKQKASEEWDDINLDDIQDFDDELQLSSDESDDLPF